MNIIYYLSLESKMIQITVDILKLKACLVLDPLNNNKLSDIKVINIY